MADNYYFSDASNYNYAKPAGIISGAVYDYFDSGKAEEHFNVAKDFAIGAYEATSKQLSLTAEDFKQSYKAHDGGLVGLSYAVGNTGKQMLYGGSKKANEMFWDWGTAINKHAADGLSSFWEAEESALKYLGVDEKYYNFKPLQSSVSDYKTNLGMNANLAEEYLTRKDGAEKVGAFLGETTIYAAAAGGTQAKLLSKIYGVSSPAMATTGQRIFTSFLADTAVAAAVADANEYSKIDPEFNNFKNELLLNMAFFGFGEAVYGLGKGVGSVGASALDSKLAATTRDNFTGFIKNRADSLNALYESKIRNTDTGKKIMEGLDYLKLKNKKLYDTLTGVANKTKERRAIDTAMTHGMFPDFANGGFTPLSNYSPTFGENRLTSMGGFDSLGFGEKRTPNLYAGAKATGFQTAEGKFSSVLDRRIRFEIDDSNSKLVDIDKYFHTYIDEKGQEVLSNMKYRNGQQRVLLSEILDHPELYKQYPDFKDLSVIIDNSLPPESAYYDDIKSTIALGIGTKLENIRSLNLHEIQHTIQAVEGFPSGTSFEGVLRLINIADRPKLKKAWDEFAKENNIVKLREVGTKPEEELSMFSSYLKKNKYGDIYDEYARVLGEIEARDVQARMNMTKEERSGSGYLSSQGYKNEDIIIPNYRGTQIGKNFNENAPSHKKPLKELADKMDLNPQDVTVYAKQRGISERDAIYEAWRLQKTDKIKNYAIKDTYSDMRDVARKFSEDKGFKAKSVDQLEKFVQGKLESGTFFETGKDRDFWLAEKAKIQKFREVLKESNQEKLADDYLDDALKANAEHKLLTAKAGVIKVKKSLNEKYKKLKGKIANKEELRDAVRDIIRETLKDNNVKTLKSSLRSAMTAVSDVNTPLQADKLLDRIQTAVEKELNSKTKEAVKKLVKRFSKSKTMSGRSKVELKDLYDEYKNGEHEPAEFILELNRIITEGKQEKAMKTEMIEAEKEIAVASIIDDFEKNDVSYYKPDKEGGTVNSGKAGREVGVSFTESAALNLLDYDMNVLDVASKIGLEDSNLYKFLVDGKNKGVDSYYKEKFPVQESVTEIVTRNKLDEASRQRLTAYGVMKMEGGKEKLQNSMSESAFKEFLDEYEAKGDSYLTKGERELYDYSREFWDNIEERVFDAVEMDTGIRPKHVENYVPIEIVDFGEMTNAKGELLKIDDHNNVLMPSLLGGKAGKRSPNVAMGSKVERVEHNRSINLDFVDVLVKFADQAIYYKNMQPAIRKSRSIIDDPRVRERIGGETYSNLSRSLDNMAQKGYATANIPVINSIIKNMTFKTFAWNPFSAFNIVVTSPFESILNIGVKATVDGYKTKSGLSGYTSKQIDDFIQGASGKMKARASDKVSVQAMLEGLKMDTKVDWVEDGAIGELLKKKDKFGEKGMFMLAASDKLTSQSTWIGAYRQKLEELGEKFDLNKIDERASLHADRAVELSHGTNQTTSMSNFMSRGDIADIKVGGKRRTVSVGRSIAAGFSAFTRWIYTGRFQGIYNEFLHARYGKAAGIVSANLAKTAVTTSLTLWLMEMTFMLAQQSGNYAIQVGGQTFGELVKQSLIAAETEGDQDVWGKVGEAFERSVGNDTYKSFAENSKKATIQSITALPYVAQFYDGVMTAWNDKREDDVGRSSFFRHLVEGTYGSVASVSKMVDALTDPALLPSESREKAAEATRELFLKTAGLVGVGGVGIMSKFNKQYSSNNQAGEEIDMEKAYLQNLLGDGAKGQHKALQRYLAVSFPTGMIDYKGMQSVIQNHFRAKAKEDGESMSFTYTDDKPFTAVSNYQFYLGLDKNEQYLYERAVSDASYGTFDYIKSVYKDKPVDTTTSRFVYNTALEKRIADVQLRKYLGSSQFARIGKPQQKINLTKLWEDKTITMDEYTLAISLIELQFDEGAKDRKKA